MMINQIKFILSRCKKFPATELKLWIICILAHYFTLQNANDRTMLKGFRRVAVVEDFYDILQQIHDKDCLHAGSKKTFARVIIMV